MRIITSGAFVALLSLTAAYAQQPQSGRAAAAPSTVKKLSRAEFDALIKDPSKLLLLDVRRPDELTSIGGFAAYLSIQAGDLANELAYVPRDRAIVTVSNHASRATRAAELLKKEGFNVVGAVGAQEYESEGGTLVKVAPPAVKTQ